MPITAGIIALLLFVTGFINSLVHARDAWAVMPMGLVFSVVVLVLATVATGIAFSGLRPELRP